MKDVLIVCYGFPPNPGIGGRRWGKFAKYLVKKGFNVNVISCQNASKNISSWQNDVAGINTYSLPLRYPKVFIDPPHNIFDKINFRITKAYYEITQSKRIYDKAFLWEKQFIKKAEDVIKRDGTKNIIVTGAPFYLLYYTAKLKLKFPYLNIIADYRDPWIGGVQYGMDSIGSKGLSLEQDMQNFVYQHVDYITAPNSFLLNKIKDTLTVNYTDDKFVELPHAYDIDDLTDYLKRTSVVKDKKIRFVYGGTFYSGTDVILKELCNFLDELKKRHPMLYNRLSFNFFTPEKYYENIFEDHQDIVKFHLPVGDRIFAEISEVDFCLLFLADHNKDYCTTKFFEYLPFKKPYILLGEKGYVAETIEQKNLGLFFQSGSIANSFNEFLERHQEGKQQLSLDVDVEDYSFDRITDKLIDLLVK